MTDLIDIIIIEIENATWRKEPEGPWEIVAWDAFRVKILESGKIGFLADISPDDENAAPIAWATRIVLKAAGQESVLESFTNCKIRIRSVGYFCERYMGQILFQEWDSGWLEIFCDGRPQVSMDLPPDGSTAWTVLMKAQDIYLAVHDADA